MTQVTQLRSRKHSCADATADSAVQLHRRKHRCSCVLKTVTSTRTVSESPKCSKTSPPSRSGSYFSVYRLSIIIDGHSAAYWAGVDGVQINDVVVTLAVLMSYWYSDFHSRLIDLLTSTGTCNLPVRLRKRAIPVQSPSTVYLTELGLDKMVNILQTTFSNEFCRMKIISFSFVFHQNLFLGVQLQ